MSKNRNQDALLADYAVHLAAGGHRKIRASSLIVVESWLYLRDAGGGILFSAPSVAVKYVKRLEPGEEILADPLPQMTGAYWPLEEVASRGSGPVLLDDPRCTSPNSTGRRCKLDAVPGTDRCAFHPWPAP